MNPTPFSITIGVDIAKKKFDAASLIDSKYKHKTFDNNELGHIADIPHPQILNFEYVFNVLKNKCFLFYLSFNFSRYPTNYGKIILGSA